MNNQKKKVPEAQARYDGVASPSGARSIIVDRCPYCQRMHRHMEVVGVKDAGLRMADCFKGEYQLTFTNPQIGRAHV